MLKETQNVNSVISRPDSRIIDNSSNTIFPAQFIGYSKSKKGHKFNSNKTRHNALLSPASTKEWLNDSPSPLTFKLRKAFHVYLEVSLDVQNYQMSPVEIPYTDSKDKKRKYHPLFLINYWTDDTAPKNRKNLLADIWSDEDIRQNSDWFIPAWRAAHRFAQYKRLNFCIFRDSFFQSDYFYNFKFAQKYRWLIANEEDWNLIDQLFEKHNKIRVCELLKIGSKSSEHRKRLTHSLWTLVAMGCVKTDWTKRFNLNTILWI